MRRPRQAGYELRGMPEGAEPFLSRDEWETHVVRPARRRYAFVLLASLSVVGCIVGAFVLALVSIGRFVGFDGAALASAVLVLTAISLIVLLNHWEDQT